jgi:hypothetical protein
VLAVTGLDCDVDISCCFVMAMIWILFCLYVDKNDHIGQHKIWLSDV